MMNLAMSLAKHFAQQNCGIQAVEIDNLQAHFSLPLPEYYIEFLKKYGNVVLEEPLPNSILISIYGKRLIGGIAHFFSPVESYSLYEELREESYYADEPQISETMLPIAEMVDMEEGDYILLDLKSGAVLANKFDISRSSDISSYGVIAADFEVFLTGIKTHEALESIVGEDALYEILNIDEPEED